jgi:glycine/D-amino acid oxidase-like deaminating enzyme
LNRRCIVVGAGVIGCSVAARLATAGSQVTLLDAAEPASGTSATTFAWVGPSALGLWEYFDLNVAGLAAYRRIHAELGETPWFHARGSLVWFSDAAAEANLVERVAQLRATGYPAALLTAARANELEPGVRFDGAERVAFYSDEGYVFARPMIADLLSLARARGAVTRWRARVVAIDEAPTAVRATLADGERVEADTIILCTGRWTGESARMVGAEIPMLPADERGALTIGLLVLTTPLAQRLDRVLIADELMIRPDGGGRLLLHSDEHDRMVDPTDTDDALRALGRQVAAAAAPYLEVGAPLVEAASRGTRALTGDLLPAVGRLGDGGRVYAAVTHSGITLAPLLGELIASEILTEVDEPLLARFRPGRFIANHQEPLERRMAHDA